MKWLCSAAILASVCLPLAARGDDDVKPDRTPVEIPYTMTKFQHVVIRAKINGKGPFNFILDTGAPALIISKEAGKKIGLKPGKGGWADLDRLEVEGGLVVPMAGGIVDTPFQLEGMNGLGLAGVEIHGLIGSQILRRYIMEIDFTKDKMTWTPTGAPPEELKRMGGGGSPGGGLEVFGSIMKMMGGLIGTKAAPDYVTRGYIGIELDDSDALKIKAVQEGSPAALAGLKVGDKLTKLQGKTVKSIKEAVKFADKVAPGAIVTLTIVRGDATKEISFKTGEGL